MVPEIWGTIRTPEGDGKLKMTAKRSDLQKEYRYVLDITNKIMMGMVGSYDQLSTAKYTVLGALIQHQRINWHEYIYRQLVREVNKVQWVESEKKSKQKLAYGTQISWILEFLGKAKGKSDPFVSSKKLGHFQGRKAGATKVLKWTQSGTSSYKGVSSDSEATESDAARPVEFAENVTPPNRLGVLQCRGTQSAWIPPGYSVTPPNRLGVLQCRGTQYAWIPPGYPTDLTSQLETIIIPTTHDPQLKTL
ncbi:hypothetical protein OROMI_016428 [Orobanche minor]